MPTFIVVIFPETDAPTLEELRNDFAEIIEKNGGYDFIFEDDASLWFRTSNSLKANDWIALLEEKYSWLSYYLEQR